MKKGLLILMLLLTVCLAAGLVSCGKDDTTSTVGSTTKLSADATITTGAPTTTDPLPEGNYATLKDGKATITGLQGDLVMSIYQDTKGASVYTLSTKNGEEIIAPSLLGITASNFPGFDAATITNVSARHFKRTYPYLGNFSEMTDDCVAATVTFEKEGYTFYMEIKLYDNGVTFRYHLPYNQKNRMIRGENTAFKVNNIMRAWYGTGSDCYESAINSATYAAISQSEKLNGPITIELTQSKGYVVLMEGAVADTYIGTNFIATGNNTFAISGSWTAGRAFDSFTATGDITTGWRVINYAKDLGDIVTNNNIYHTALGMDENTKINEADWVVPGKSAWSWINNGGVPFEDMIIYTLAGARLGFDYNIIDEGYTRWEDYEAKLKEVGLLGETNGIKQILWCAVSNGHSGLQIATPQQAKGVIKKLVEYHMYGMKLDFFHSETTKNTQAIQIETLKEALENEIIINFHGVHKPTSMSVIYPNEVTREGIRGLEQGLRGNYAIQAQYITRQYYTRFLSGHADFTPDVNTAMQIGSLVLMDSPLTVIATDPTLIMKNPALEMIRAVPTVWDKTVFLDGAIGSFVSVAKESSGTWYVGGVYATAKSNVKIDLSKFLGEGNYLLSGWKDISTAKMEEITMTVTQDSTVELGKIPANCGYVLKITKLDISQHGGEIKDAITVTTANAASVVKYTIDGSDPMTSNTAKAVEGGKITLSDTCKLRLAIVEGDGKGTSLSYNFNKIRYNSVEIKPQYNDGNSVITLTPTEEGAKIYYTLDGSNPTTASTLYIAPITIREQTTVKAIAVNKDGETSGVKSATVIVRKEVTSIKPDVYLGRDYLAAVAGWDNRIMVDISMNSTTLSLGGTNKNNGTKFDHGISTNAIGYFDYAIPENAKEFVGVAGIDDSTYDNVGDGNKASIIVTIYIDNNLVYTSQKLGQGQFEQIRVTIPEGAEKIRIHFGDAGDGITCDNADLCDGGFLLQ